MIVYDCLSNLYLMSIIYVAVYCRTWNVFRYKLSHILLLFLFLLYFYFLIIVHYLTSVPLLVKTVRLTAINKEI